MILTMLTVLMRTYRIPVALVLLLGASCSVKTPPSVPEVVEEALPETTAIPLDFESAAAAATGQVRDGWLKTFGDPGLEAIVAEAIQNNLNLRAAVAKVDAAAGFATQAGAELKPAIGVGGQALNRDGFSSGDPYVTSTGVSLNVSWELDIWGRVRAQAQAGQAAFEAAQYELEWAYQSIAAQTAKTWFLVTEAQLQERLAEEALGLYERTVELVEVKFDVGQVTQKELSLARANVATGQVALRQARRGRQQAARALELILGRYPAADIEGAIDLVATPPPIPVGVPSELLERRPDMLAAERAVAAEFLQLESARAARLPRIGLTAGTGNSSTDLNDVLQLGSGYWSVGANFFAPIYQGGALQAQVEIETAGQETALANYGMAALKAFGEVEQGLDNETLLREQEAYLDVAVREASEALRIAQDQFDVGRVDLLSVLQQQGQVLAARVQLLNIRDQRLQQRVDLHLAVGGGFEAPKPEEGEKP
ncbi:MAG: TolC family protein [Deltaproteobacteria bacterium]|nr:TolC family protein [Deltaproteobacteria bacterium]